MATMTTNEDPKVDLVQVVIGIISVCLVIWGIKTLLF